ncbi:hypothetical protein L6164_013090 [Bauhinia variegata]|uniref:Uncharacterized protein n=1 Tax=Bauhinia variegata TaxID=167791 RepID=A0ACB9PD91_BAUVA|nr:hypothetical protein L6164_013090 [Bauhinia variegata]
MAKSEQFRLIELKLPTLYDQDIKTQVQQTHRRKDSLVLRKPLLVSICHILKPATNFVDSTLLNNNESQHGVELASSIILELNSILSELDALIGDGCFNTRALLERQNPNTRIKHLDTMLVKFSAMLDLKTLAEYAYFMFPALLMDKTAHNAVQRFDEIDLHVASMDLLKFLRCLSWDAKVRNTLGCFVFKFLEFSEFLLHGPNQPITELASSMPSLKKNPVSLEGSPLEKLLIPLDQLNNLMKLTLEVIEYISELTLLADTEYSNEDLLSTSAHWAILSVVACYLQITLLMQNG